MEKTNETQLTEYCGTNGVLAYAGVHLLVELWQARHLDAVHEIERIMRHAVVACGATLLSIDLHEFSPGGGVSGVAVLKESHISIHTWPEYEYAAMDIFVCGTIDPYPAVRVVREGFEPGRLQVMDVKRGIM